MRVLVTGASGLLGRAIVIKAEEAGHEVKGLAFTRAGGNLVKLDLHDSDKLKELCQDFKPDVLIHAAAERRPDVAEKDPAAARRLNVEVTQGIAKICKELDIVLIYTSTDYVFNGEAPAAGYQPSDPTEPLQLYGETKLAGEEEVLKHGKAGKCVVLRVPVLYGPVEQNSESAVNILVDVVKAQKQAKMDDWSPRYPTNVQDVARVMLDIGHLYRNSLDITLPPILHFSSQVMYSKLDMSNFFAKVVGVQDTSFLIPVREGPGPNDTRRPKDCHLSNKVLEDLGIDAKEEVSFTEWFSSHLA